MAHTPWLILVRAVELSQGLLAVAFVSSVESSCEDSPETILPGLPFDCSGVTEIMDCKVLYKPLDMKPVFILA